MPKSERERLADKAYWDRNKERLNAKKREHYKANKERILERGRKYRQANPEKSRAIVAASKLKHHDKTLAGQRKYYAKNKHRQAAYYRSKYQQERDQICEKSRVYYYANKEKFRARYRKYMARKLGAAVSEDREPIQAFYKLVRDSRSVRCYWCAMLVPKGKRHIDHIIPLSKGGPDAIHNLCCSCESCNLRKASKLPEVFSGQHVLAFAC